MKNINLYRLYLGSAIIILIIISSISSYFVLREILSKKYISEKTYISMFYNEYFWDQCSYYDRGEKKKSESEIKKCIEKQKQNLLVKREYRYKFNILKYWVLLLIVLSLLWIHSFLYLFNKRK